MCVKILGMSKGLIFTIGDFLLPSILLIPAILGIAVSGFKLYKSIVKDKRRDNIKLEVLRHTVFSIIMLLIMFTSSIIEIFISTNFLKLIIKYF